MMSVAGACRAVLMTAEPRAKVKAARALWRAWRAGALEHEFDVAMPERPARPDRPELRPPSQMPRRGRAGSERTRIAMLHALAHIEFGAIDLAVDMAGRFGAGFPRDFVSDWLGVAADEAIHFALLDRRLRALGAGYGALPAHDGLWDAAAATADDPLARLAVVPMVLEARGLDVTPGLIARFGAAGDDATVAVLRRILHDEVGHVAVGDRWFRHLCAERGVEPEATFATVLEEAGVLVRPPLNEEARLAAGFSPAELARLAGAASARTAPRP